MQRDIADREKAKAATGDGQPISVCAMFDRQVGRTPAKIALICADRTLTYAQLAAEVDKLARYLRSDHGVGPEAVVGLLLGRSERMLISMLAVLKAGGAYLPLSPDYPAHRIDYVLRDCAPKLLLSEREHVELAGVSAASVLSWDDPPKRWRDGTGAPLSDEPAPGQLAYIMYTSGSTGRPKGVMAEHRNLGNFIEWCIDEYRESAFDIAYAVTPYGFDLSSIELFFPLAIGATIRLLPSAGTMALWLKRDHNVLVNTVPSLVQELMKTNGILRNVSVLNLGGEAVPPSLARALREHPHIEARNMYGPTETTSTAISHRMNGSSEVQIGKPIANMVAYVVDEHMQRVPCGAKGEICIGGHGLTRGYWNRPELTRQRYVDDPFRPGERLYRTGDIGCCLPDGNLKFLGRNDNQIKIRGFRIELEEIETQLGAHPDVMDAVAGMRSDGGRERIVAAVRPVSMPLNIRALKAFLAEHLPPYMVPEEFFAVEALPLTPTGKIDRRALFEANFTCAPRQERVGEGR